MFTRNCFIYLKGQMLKDDVSVSNRVNFTLDSSLRTEKSFTEAEKRPFFFFFFKLTGAPKTQNAVLLGIHQFIQVLHHPAVIYTVQVNLCYVI